jgi:hypothetical protein
MFRPGAVAITFRDKVESVQLRCSHWTHWIKISYSRTRNRCVSADCSFRSRKRRRLAFEGFWASCQRLDLNCKAGTCQSWICKWREELLLPNVKEAAERFGRRLRTTMSDTARSGTCPIQPRRLRTAVVTASEFARRVFGRGTGSKLSGTALGPHQVRRRVAASWW